jgi:hypothetical protein
MSLRWHPGPFALVPLGLGGHSARLQRHLTGGVRFFASRRPTGADFSPRIPRLGNIPRMITLDNLTGLVAAPSFTRKEIHPAQVRTATLEGDIARQEVDDL